jgi:hypothetical protein
MEDPLQMSIPEWLATHQLEQYSQEFMDSGAETVADLVRFIVSTNEIAQVCPSMLNARFHVLKFVTSLNAVGGTCASLEGCEASSNKAKQGTKFLDRTLPSFGYRGLVQAGFVCPCAVFLLSFQFKGILPVPSTTMTTIKNMLWAASCQATRCLYITPDDFKLLCTLLGKLFPQCLRVAGFKGFHAGLVAFWQKIRQNNGCSHLEVPANEEQNDAFEELFTAYPSLRASGVETVADIGDKEQNTANAVVLASLAGNNKERNIYKAMAEMMTRLMGSDLSSIFGVECKNLVARVEENCKEQPADVKKPIKPLKVRANDMEIF